MDLDKLELTMRVAKINLIIAIEHMFITKNCEKKLNDCKKEIDKALAIIHQSELKNE